MAAPFAQTIRSLDADRSYGQIIVLAAFALLLTLWLVWVFAARIPARLTSTTNQIRLDATVTVTFSGEGVDKVQPGQPALVYLDAPPLAASVVLPARVVDVALNGATARVTVMPDFSGLEVDDVPEDVLAAFARPTPGRVEVEVERVSPATLVLRASGLNVDSGPVILNR